MTAALAIPAMGYTQHIPLPAPQPPMLPAMTEFWEPAVTVISPGENNASPPSDAIILFNGKDLSQWEGKDGTPARWKVDNGIMTVAKGTGDIHTKIKFADFQLHVEWMIPVKADAKQNTGNSGIYLQGLYEVQIWNSHDIPLYANGQAGSIYKQSPPLVNAMRKPGEWNSYDIIYTAPRFKENGSLFSPARVTVLHNGVLIQNNTEITGGTVYKGLPAYKAHGKGPILLQDHSDDVNYRNIWIREL